MHSIKQKYLLAVLLLLTTFIANAQKKTELLLMAEESLISGDTLLAVNQFRQVLTIYPQSFAAAMRLAEVHYHQQDFRTAILYCNVAIDINENFQIRAKENLQPSNQLSQTQIEETQRIAKQYAADRADIHHLKGLIRARQSRLDDAVEQYKEALDIKIDDKIITDLALVYLEKGLLNDAMHLLHQARLLAPDEYSSYFNLANAHHKIRQLDSALYYYQIVQKLSPEFKWPYLYSGIVYTKKQAYPEAIEQLSRFLALDSTHEEAYFRRAVLLSEMRQWKKALEDWDKVIGLNAGNAEAWRNAGLSYFQMADYDSAIHSFNKALTLNPAQAYTFINRGYSYYLTGQPEKALEDLNRGLTDLPKYYLGHYFRSLVYWQLKKKKKACQDLQQAIKLGMKDSEIDKKLLKKCF